ncbi:MAG: hypothetical protein WAM11_05100 [Cyanobium sp.]
MIRSFRCADTKALASGWAVPRFQAFERVARRKLRQLEIAQRLEDLRFPPGNRLEPLRGRSGRPAQHPDQRPGPALLSLVGQRPGRH